MRGFALVSSVLETPVTVIPVLRVDTKALLFPGNCSPCTAVFSRKSHSLCLDKLQFRSSVQLQLFKSSV